MNRRRLSLGLSLALLATGAMAEGGRRTLTLPDTAFDNLPEPVSPFDMSDADIFSLGGLLEVIESIPDRFDQQAYWQTLRSFRAMEIDGALPALSSVEVHYTIRVHGDWQLEHSDTGQMLLAHFEQGVLHRMNLELPGYEYPWQFAAQVPHDAEAVSRLQLHAQADTASGNYRDIREEGFEGALGAAAQHLFRPQRFPGITPDALHRPSFDTIPEDGLFSGPFTGVEGGTIRADLRDPAGVAFRARTPVMEYEAEDGHITPRPTGRGAIVTVTICPLTIWQTTPRFCDPPLQIDDFTPRPNRENVALEDPQFRVDFSEPIDLESLEDNFAFHTMSEDGEPMPVTGDWVSVGPARYAFEPHEDLRSGTRYRAEIRGGEGGVLSFDRDAVLEEGEEWFFSTWLDFDEQRPEDPERPVIRMHHYQIDRDGLLTSDKPTVTRAWFDWEPHSDIHPDWQPESFLMEIRTSEDAPRWQGQHGFGPRGQALRIWRSDDDEIFDDEDRRMARHTAQFYGWRPRIDSRFRLDMAPDNPWPLDALPEFETRSHDYQVWSHNPRPLRLHFAFALVAEWAEGVPAQDSIRAHAMMSEVARQIPSFFPHTEARLHRLRAPTFDSETLENVVFSPEGETAEAEAPAEVPRPRVANELSFDEFCALFAETFPNVAPPAIPTDDSDDLDVVISGVVNYYHRLLRPGGELQGRELWWQVIHQASTLEAAAAGRADVIVLIVPPGFFAGATVGYAIGMETYRGFAAMGVPGMRLYLAAHIPDIPFDELVQLHLHELGHEFGLEHVPGDSRPPGQCARQTADGTPLVDGSDLDGRREEGMEAWRLAPGGMEGWNKSVTEGNAEVEDNTLVSMMWPFVMETRFMSLLDFEVARMQRSIVEGPSEFWRPVREARGNLSAPGRPAADWAMLAQSATDTTSASASSSDAATDAAPPPDERLVVTGLVSDNGGGLIIQAIQRMPPADLPPPPDGPYQAQITDAAGNVLARAPLGLRAPIAADGLRAPDDPLGWYRFHLEITLPEGAANLAIMEEGRLRAQLVAGARPPLLSAGEVSAQGTDDLRLTWQMQGDAQALSLAYSPNGQEPWVLLSHHVSSDRMADLALRDLASGAAPTLRISARNGVQFSDLLLSIPDGLLPAPGVILHPPATGSLQAGAPLVLQFDSPMRWSTLPAQLALVDEAGRELAIRALADQSAQNLTLILDAAETAPEGVIELIIHEPLHDAFGRTLTLPPADRRRFAPEQ